MDSITVLFSGLLSVLPISELRGAIPYALAKGIPTGFAVPFCIFLNALVGPLVYIFLNSVHKIFQHFTWYQKLFDKIVENARNKIQGKVEKYGYLGIMLFVAVPLPITGAYTGTLGAWVLGLQPKKTFLSVLGGVMISGTIVTLVSVLGIEAFSLFIKTV